jgi:hypothetical protein
VQILNLEWLIKMLEKSGARPEARLLGLFEILSGWLEAPQIHASLKHEATKSTKPYLLLNYLSDQAKEAGAAMPEMLAEQLIFIATNALKDRIENPESSSFTHAKQVAKALISAQCEREVIQFKKSTLYSALATFLGALVIGVLITDHQTSKPLQNKDVISSLFEQNKLKEDVRATPSKLRRCSPQLKPCAVATANTLRRFKFLMRTKKSISKTSWVGKSHPMSTTNLLHSTTYKKYVVITRLCS